MSIKYNFSKSVSVRICGQQHTRVHPLGSVRFFPTRQHATSATFPASTYRNVDVVLGSRNLSRVLMAEAACAELRQHVPAQATRESVGTQQEARWIRSIGDDVSATVSDTDGVVEKRSHSGWNAPFPRRTKKCSGVKQRDHR